MFFFLALFFPIAFLGCATPGPSGYDTDPIADQPPPPLQLEDSPDMAVVPSEGADVYMAPNTEGLSFYDDTWYRNYNGYWFSSPQYSGPWTGIRLSAVPGPVAVIPPDYIRRMPPGYHRIPYREFRDNWRRWGQTHYWRNQPWYREHDQHHWGGVPFRRPAPPPPRRIAAPAPHKTYSPRPSTGRPIAYRPSPSPPPRRVTPSRPAPAPRPAAMHRPSASPPPRAVRSAPVRSGGGRRR